MNRKKLESLPISELENIASDLDIKPSSRKGETISKILIAFDEWEKYKREQVDRYKKIKVLGNKGREASAFLVYDTKTKTELAQKCFRKNKSSDSIRKQYEFQCRAYDRGISPKIIDYDTVSKTITMEKMEYDLIDLIQRQKGILTREQQSEILNIFNILDELKIFHGDSNGLNFMYNSKNVLKIIDFGFAQEINNKLINKFKTNRPNSVYLVMGLITQLKRIFSSYTFSYLEENIDIVMLEKFRKANPKI